MHLKFIIKKIQFRHVQAHLIMTQYKAQGPLGQLVMARLRGVDPEPYHNKSNPEIGVRERDITQREY